MHAPRKDQPSPLLLIAAAALGCRAQPSPNRAVPIEAAPAPCAARPPTAPPPAAPEASARRDEPFATDPQNRQKPDIESDELTDRASHLLEAIATGRPERGDDFFFPRAPFLPLKDVGDPGRYFDQLLATYHRDIRELRASRRDWESPRLVSFAIGSTPTWVAPGHEYNRIGYYRTFHGRLRWQSERSSGTIDVSTIISYHGRWYITHLAPIRR
jgi:hypothetical protein